MGGRPGVGGQPVRRLEHLWIVYPGDEAYSLDERIAALPIGAIPRFLDGLMRKRR